MIRALLIVCVAMGVAAADPTTNIKIHGRIVDRVTNEPLIGATIITGSGQLTESAITDENGLFVVDAAPGATSLTIYYLEATVERPLAIAGCADDIDAGTIAITIPVIDDCCACYFGPPPMIDIETALATRMSGEWPPLRTRDSTSALALVAGRPRPQTTWLDDNRRLAGAPGVALALLDEVDVYTMRGASRLEQANDGIALSTKSGSNENHGTARIAFDGDTPALEASVGGPIVVDSAWWWTGAVLGSSSQQEIAKLSYLASPDQQGNVVGMHTIEPVVAPPGARAITNEVRDDWASGEWISKFDDNKLLLAAGASGERLDDGAITTRGAAHVRVQDRVKVLGPHDIKAYGEIGGGTFGTIDHRDATASAGDVWELLSNLVIDAGVRWDERRFGDARADVTSPHATIGYDWTKEGMSQAFVTVDRTSLLDAGALGGWLTAPRYRDDVIAGASYEVYDSWLVTAAVRTSELAGTRTTGVDASADHHGRIDFHLTASSVDRAVAGYATMRLSWLRAGLSGRLAPATDIYGSQVGAVATWHHDLGYSKMSTDVGAEIVDDRLGKLARAVVSFTY